MGEGGAWTTSRRTLLRGSLAGAASLILPRLARAADFAPVEREIQKRHGEAVQRLQDWIHQPTIAAEGVGGEEGVQHFIRLLKDAGFQRAERLRGRCLARPRAGLLRFIRQRKGTAGCQNTPYTTYDLVDG
jgi:hypothetical protein